MILGTLDRPRMDPLTAAMTTAIVAVDKLTEIVMEETRALRERADADLERDQVGLHHQTTQHLERVGFGCDVEVQPAAGGDFFQQLPAADAALGERDGVGGAIAQPHSALGCQWMVCGHYCDQPLLQRHQRLEIGEEGRAKHKH